MQVNYRPKVSVIIPCYNQGVFLGEAIESAVNQGEIEAEIIVVNDGSIDETDKIARAFDNIIYISQENQGLSRARNAGYRKSSGDYLVFLDSDDRLPKNALSSGLNSLLNDPVAAFTYGQMQVIDSEGNRKHVRPEPETRENHYKDFLIKNYVPTPGMVMFRKSTLEQFGLFDAEVPESADYDIYLRITRHATITSHRNLAVERRIHGSMMTSNPGKMLACTFRVHNRHREYARQDPELRQTYQEGRIAFRSYYGNALMKKMGEAIRRLRPDRFIYHLYFFLRYSPQYFLYLVTKPESHH